MRERLANVRRFVLKLGTHVVTRDGLDLALGRITSLVEAVATEHRAGRQPILVTSGAIGLGARMLKLDERPASLGLRQACAAVGQGRLIGIYIDAFDQLGVTAAQVLLSQDDLADPDRALCLRTTLLRLIELGVVPILNENDSVSVSELIAWRRTDEGGSAAPREGFGDNDGLSARVASSLDADLLLLLTDVDAVYTGRPGVDPTATPIHTLDQIDDAVLNLAYEGSAAGTGGMASKLAAAKQASEAGVDVVIANGTTHEILSRILAGDTLGTWMPATNRLPAKRRFIALEAPRRGTLTINLGAAEALKSRKASLLPIGVEEVDGDFAAGDVVEIRDGGGRVLGRGLANYNAHDCRRLRGRHSADILDVIGWKGYDTLITRDHLVLADFSSKGAP
ncbi:MAG: glutamate 5-kinase [Nannocystaceae bacterium]